MSGTRARRRLIFAVTLVAATFPAPATDRPPLPVSIGLSPYAGRLVTVPVVIEKQTLTFLLDTGGGQTLITPRVAALIGCTPSGRSVGFRMNGDRVEFKHCGDTRLETALYRSRSCAVGSGPSTSPTATCGPIPAPPASSRRGLGE